MIKPIPGAAKNEGVLRAKIRRRLSTRGRMKRVAHELGTSPSVLCQIVNGKRRISARVAAGLGYQKVIVWERIPTPEPTPPLLALLLRDDAGASPQDERGAK
ncbi:hypothetical protein [Allosphingosinicella indica]|uniref:Uncharacterized protein n=1 Tax=Allosphingosinicella indica TaxID=941907 RepID=A0A1X7GJF5_9SPHN|nr:hypothetical protein [Allosphingosinicella indica]SMF70613.1 hypothetical protein SAMN06295910_1907 [Allosphingosinicella indica]